MKVEGWLFLGCGTFFGGSDVVYWYTSKDPTGTVFLALAVGFAVLVGFYVLFTGRRMPRRPEDDNTGEIEQGTGEIGFFSPHSWWPLFLALSAASTTAATSDTSLTAGREYVLLSRAKLLAQAERREAREGGRAGDVGFHSCDHHHSGRRSDCAGHMARHGVLCPAPPR